MKIGVDISWMVGQYRGMGHFGRQLIAPISNQIVALAPKGISTTDWQCISRGLSFFPWWEQIELPRLCRSEQLDYLLCPYNTGPIRSVGSTQVIAVIHDLIYLQPFSIMPPSTSYYQTFGRLYRRYVVPAFVQRANTIVTVSDFTKRALVEQFGLAEENIHIIPNTIEDIWFEKPLPLNSRKPYFFSVAGESPSKNIHGLLKGFALALTKLQSNVKLKIAGVKHDYQDSFKKLATELGVANNVEFLGFISLRELRQHYREAQAFVFASLFEGFGIPLLEAMASGTPVACSNTSSMPEVVGKCALMFDPSSIEDIARALRMIWQDTPEREILTNEALDRALGFSESVVSQNISAFWRELL